jgi:acetoacetate decarboxylase
MLPALLTHDAKVIAEVLGPPDLEQESDQTIERDYAYHGQTLTLRFDKNTGDIVSAQMFFLPPVDEAAAFELIGLPRRNAAPTIDTDLLRVWTPYGNLAKVRLSLNNGQVMAIIIEP